MNLLNPNRNNPLLMEMPYEVKINIKLMSMKILP